MTYNKTTGTLRDPYQRFSLSSFLNAYCFTDEKTGEIIYFTDKKEAVATAMNTRKNVSVKPVQGRFVIMLNL